MTGYNGNRWTREQHDRLAQIVNDYRDMGRRVPWDEVARALGHPKSSCQQIASRIKAEQLNIATREALRQIRLAHVAAPMLVPSPAQLPRKPKIENPDYGRSTSTHRLMMDAELRGRISVLGVTGGLLGDPAPGRSALDKIRAGIPDSPYPVDRRTVHRATPVPITLATEPAR